VPCGRVTDPKEHPPVECLLSVDESESSELQTEQATLVDDEELELSELQAGPNPLRCSAHLSSTGRHGCPLCKGAIPSCASLFSCSLVFPNYNAFLADLLARFPPPSVRMKQPFPTKPWESSPEMVKKLFQVICNTLLCDNTVVLFSLLIEFTSYEIMKIRPWSNICPTFINLWNFVHS
jgi:hypothetical protein